ncbi:ATP-binding protein [Plantibacter flavus]|uniref:ATP-binding protein n=1 Tax=Plantibacter flavus TaxID=150123 RepID=UPI0019617CA8|nr:ATP-binding protein [Plantibacter flavus]
MSVKIRGFRGYVNDQSVQFDDMTTLIGKNDAGKSTILEALEIFFNNDVVKIDHGDCNITSEDRKIEISCVFSQFPNPLVLDAQAETSLANERLLTPKGELCIKKVWNASAAKLKEEVYVRAFHPTAEKYADLLQLTHDKLKARYKELGIEDPGVNLSVKSSIRSSIWSSVSEDELKLAEVDLPVSTAEVKGIWEKLAVHLPLYALFQADRASRDSDSEVQDPMKLAIAAALAEEDVQKKLTEITDAVRLRATELATRTHKALAKLDADLAKQLVPKFKSEPKWAGLFSIALDGEDGIPINKRGSGVRRLVLVSFFRAEAERKLEEGAKQNIIYAIEEPETSQHPRNQKVLLDSLRILAESDGCQVLLTTHSPGFASYLDVESLRFISREPGMAPTVENASEPTWERIASELGVVPDNRVKALVCVEGPTDVVALKSLSSALHAADHSIIDLTTDPRVAFVVLGGGTLQHWVNHHYLQGLGRPEMHIYDSDVEKYAQSITQVNERTDGSWGQLTKKYEIENYLHPDAISEGLGFSISFSDQDDVPALVKAVKGWNPNTAKKRLAMSAFPRMSSEMIAEVDPAGEVESWLRKIEATLS